LVCPHGSKVRLIVKGPDAQQAMTELAALFQGKFGEA